MFMFDIETLGKSSESVLLSLACIHFDPAEELDWRQLKKDALFIKFDVKDQAKNYQRKIQKDTLDWWNKQCHNVKIKSFITSPDDVSLVDGMKTFTNWAKSKSTDPKEWVWIRGNLDQIVIDSIEMQLGIEPVFSYARYRDVRTAIDFLYNTENGYCKVDHFDFDPYVHITKHDPVDDCVFDIMMMKYGVKE